MRGGVCRGFQGEGVNAFAAAAVVDVAERNEHISMCIGGHAGLLAGFADRGVQKRFPFVRQPFRDAPGGVAVVVARGMDEEDFQDVGFATIEEQAGGLFHGWAVVYVSGVWVSGAARQAAHTS